MLQPLKNIKNGKLTLETVPPPTLPPGGVLIHTSASFISADAEWMLIDFAQKSLVGKAQARPDLALQVIQNAKKKVRSKSLSRIDPVAPTLPKKGWKFTEEDQLLS